MSRFDPSHDYNHILRVLKLAKRIPVREQSRKPSICYDTKLIILASLLHDVGNHKYAKADENASEAVGTFLTQVGAASEPARKI